MITYQSRTLDRAIRALSYFFRFWLVCNHTGMKLICPLLETFYHRHVFLLYKEVWENALNLPLNFIAGRFILREGMILS